MVDEHRWRHDVARQIVSAWKIEKKTWKPFDTTPYNLLRHGPDYVEALGGLSATANHIGIQFPTLPILDIGAGSTVGTSQIQKCFFPSQDAWATVLSRPNLNCENFALPADKVVFTPAETLSGFRRRYLKRPSQFAFVMGVMSTTYSNAPEQVVDSINNILPNGGVVKFTLFTSKSWSHADKRGVSDYFTCFELAGFGTSFLFDVPHNNFTVDVLLAIKGKDRDLATELIKNDFNARRSDKQRALEQTYQE